MEQTSNAEKQARYRKKEALKRMGDNLLLKWQGEQYFAKHKKSLQEVQHLIAKAIELPSGWTDRDLQIAELKFNQVYAELFWTVDQLSNDVHEGMNYSEKFMTAPDPRKLKADYDVAIKNTTELASHIVSALRLSACNESEQAAALMEAMRFVGRTLALNSEIPCSEANAVCLSTVGPQYVRPNWFAEKLAEALSKQLDQKHSAEVGKHLVKQ